MGSAKAKGSAYECKIVNWFRELGWHGVDRQPPRGTRDQGDIDGFPLADTAYGPYSVILEAKAEKSLGHLTDALNELESERLSRYVDRPGVAGVLGWVIYSRRAPNGTRARPVEEHYAVCTVEMLELVLRMLTGLDGQ